MVFDPQSPVSGSSSVSLEQLSQLQNDQQQAIAELQFQNNLVQSNFDGGLFTIYRDNTKIASLNNITLSTLTDGNSQGQAKLSIDSSKEPFNLSAASFNQSTNVQGGDPVDLAFNDDGTKLFVLNRLGTVNQYELPRAFDISSLNFVQSFNVADSGEIQSVKGIVFNSDGTKMLIGGDRPEDSLPGVAEFTLSTAFDISTASFLQTADLPGGIGSLEGIGISDDGTRFYVGSIFDEIQEYSLSTPFDTTTASTTTSKDISSNSGLPSSIAFNGDGTKMFVSDDDNTNIVEFSLSTGFDLSTASFVQTFNVGSQQTIITGVAFDNIGSKMITLSDFDSNVFEFRLANLFFSNGSVSLVSKDLSLEENGGFDSPPTSAIVSQDAFVGSGEDLTYTLRDGNGKAVTVTQPEVDTEVDTGNFTSTVVEVDVNLSQTGGTTPTSDDVSVLFQE